MILDTSIVLADRVAVGKTIGFHKVGDDLELKYLSRVGDGKTVFLCFHINTTFTGTTGARVRFALQSSDSTSGTINDTNVVNCTKFYTTDKLVSGAQIVVPFSPGVIYKKYVFPTIQIATAALTAGVLSAFITYNQPSNWYPGKEAAD